MQSLSKITWDHPVQDYTISSFDFNERTVLPRPNERENQLIDAIYYLCFTKSYFSKADTPQQFYMGRVSHRRKFWPAENPGVFTAGPRKKKNCWMINHMVKNSRHIGKFRNDCQFLRWYWTDQRWCSVKSAKFIDTILSQMDAYNLRTPDRVYCAPTQ